MRLTIDNWKFHLLIEMQDETTYSETYDFLNDLGYNMYWLASLLIIVTIINKIHKTYLVHNTV